MSKDQDFDIECVSYYASVTANYPDVGEIKASFIGAHAKIYGYPIFEITSAHSSCGEKRYGILRNDWKTVFKCEEHRMLPAYVKGDTCTNDYVLLNQENLLPMKDLKPKFFETYVAQRILFPDNQEITQKPTKKLEFEIGFQLLANLSDLLVFTHQKNILNYQADFLLELKNNLNEDVPSIVVEIDEEGHASYTPENEKFRQCVIESYNNRMVHIFVKRTSSQKDIEAIVAKYSKSIRDLAKDLVVEYGHGINEEDFIDTVQSNIINKVFLMMFLSMATGDVTFRYYMHQVGEFLGYSNKGNYEMLRKFLNSSHFEENIDWKVQKVAPVYRQEQLSTEKKSGNEGNGGHNKKIIIMTRACFNKLCILSRKPRSVQVAMMFAAVYEAALDYAQGLRSKMITNVGKLKENKEAAKKRMDDQVEQRKKMLDVTKLTKENEELQQKLDSFVAKTIELETTVEERDKSLQIVRTNIHKATYQISVLEEEKTRFQKRMFAVAEELRVMKEISVSNELYEKKEAELKELTVTFREYKLKYNVLVKKYNGNVVKNKSEREVKDQEILVLLEQHQKKEQEMYEQHQKKDEYTALLLARISELEKMIKPDIKVPVKIIKPVLKSPVTLVKPLAKRPDVDTKIHSPVKPIAKPDIIKPQPSAPAKPVAKPTNDVKFTKSYLTAKTINVLKDICRDKSLTGFSSQKTKSSLIDWMLTKL